MMNRFVPIFFFALTIALQACTGELVSTELEPAQDNNQGITARPYSNERVVTANRASGDISVVDAATNTLIGTFPMPDICRQYRRQPAGSF